MAIEFWVTENSLDNFPRVAIPDFIFCGLPFRWVFCHRWRVVVTQAERFPGDISERD